VSSLLVNGKDKVLVTRMEGDPGPLNKLPSNKLGGTMVRDGKTGALLSLLSGGAPELLLPTGLPKGTPADPKSIWADAKLNYRNAASDKTGTDLPVSDVIAFLANGSAGLPEICADAKLLSIIAGKNDIRSLQFSLVTEAVKSYRGQPVATALDSFVRSSMSTSLKRFSNGIDSAQSLDDGLHFARISDTAFPTEAEHKRLRDELRSSRAWLDRRLAMLRALEAGGQYDAYLIGFRDFEKHQSSFPDFINRHQEALKQSLALHRKAGADRLARREYSSAYRELKLASYREPSNSALQKEFSVAWVEYSREIAVSRQLQRPQMSEGQRVTLNRAISFAKQYLDQRKLDNALRSVLEAEAIYPRDLQTLLTKAEIYAARNEIVKALDTLDEYDLNAAGDERAAATALRDKLAFQLTDSLTELKKQIASAWTAQRFNTTRKLALMGLQADDRDAELLYYAGMSSLVTRGPEAGKFLARYLEVSDTVDKTSTSSGNVSSPEYRHEHRTRQSHRRKELVLGEGNPGGLAVLPG